MFAGILWLVREIHSNWDGAVSKRQHTLVINSIGSNILEDAIAQIKKDNISKWEEDDDDTSIDREEQILDRKDKIARLLSAYSSQYHIDPLNYWYEEFDCFLSSYGKEMVTTFIHCPTNPISKEQINNLREIGENIDFSKCNYVLILASSMVQPEIVLSDFGFIGVNVYRESEILDQLCHIPAYELYLAHKILKEKLPGGCNLTLNDTYAESSGKINQGETIASVSDYIKNWANQDESGHIAILGEYGQGKSTLCYKLAHELIIDSNKQRLPVVLELRGKSPRNMSHDELVYSWCKKYGISTDAFLSLNSYGRMILILEGFDEMDFVGDAEVRMSHFRSLWEMANTSQVKLIFTGRPNFFSPIGNELPRALLFEKKYTSNNYCKSIRLLPFGNKQVEFALRSFSDEIKRSMLELILSETTPEQVSDLLRRPSTLVWAAAAWHKLEASFRSGSMVPANVIGAILSQSYDRQLNKKLNTTILSVERQFFTTSIALRMHKDAPGVNQISYEDLKATIESMLERVPESLMEHADLYEEVTYKLTERFSTRSRMMETVLTDVRTCGVLVDDTSRAGYYKFAHKSFYEYLVGLAVAYQYLSRSSVSSEIRNLPECIISNSLKEEVSLVSFSTRRSMESVQFAGQIYAQVINEKGQRKENRNIEKVLLNEMASPLMHLSLSCLRNYFGGGFFSDVLSVYSSVFIRVRAWSIGMWFYGSLSLGADKNSLEKIIGKVPVAALLGEELKKGRNSLMLTMIFGSRQQ